MNIHLKLRLGFAGALLLLVGIGFISQNRMKQSMEDADWVSHRRDVLAQLQSLSAAVDLARIDQRGYLLVRDRNLEARFHDAQWQVTARFTRLRSLTSDSPRQQQFLDRLKLLLEQSLGAEAAIVASVRSNPDKAALQYALTSGSDERSMQEIEICFREMRSQEESLLRQRLQISHNRLSFAVAAVGASSLLAAILVAFCAFWFSRELRRRERTEATLRQSHRPWQGFWQRLRLRRKGLEARIRERTADLSNMTASLETEIGEHGKTEAELRQSEQRYRLLFEDSPLAMMVFDAETLAFLAVNAAATELFGYTREEFLRMTLRDTWPAEQVSTMLDFLDTVKTANSYTDTFVAQPKDRKLITISSRVQTIEFDGRGARLSLMTDITETKRLESQLRQSQKMEAVGSLAGGIAHDFNNLLTVILGYSDIVLRKLDHADPIRDKVAEIQAAGTRAAALTGQLLAFSRKQILQPQILELNTVVSNISEMLRRLLGEDITISLDLEACLCQVQADPTQLEQVLVNLAVNARDAMHKGGKLLIETHNIELDEQNASLQNVPAGGYALLIVTDTGCGMDEATKAQVFEPFFTTKDIGKGTGLGLSMVLGVVQQSGGVVTIHSEVGVGTTFKIYLPRFDTPVSQSAEPQESYSLPAEKGTTILLVEDEPSLRALARAVLQEAGYVVLEAINGKEALRVSEDLTCQPTLLLTDMVMSEMGGVELAEELKKKWPTLAVLYTSGYTDHALLERSAQAEHTSFLQKPYMPESLLEHVAAAIKSQPRPMVLIVDDDQRIRGQLRTSFEELGYPVLEAADGQQAMAQIGAHPVQLVITDLVMPEKDGLELIRALGRSYPDMKIIAISGAFGGAYLGAASMLGADLVLEKPFQQQQVVQKAKTLVG